MVTLDASRKRSDPRMENSGIPTSYLARLPPELHQLIVDMAAEVDMEARNPPRVTEGAAKTEDDGAWMDEKDEDETDEVKGGPKDEAEDEAKEGAGAAAGKTDDAAGDGEESLDGEVWEPYTSALVALSAVNRAFHAMCVPIIWAEVDTKTWTNTQLERLREEVIVRQAVHIKRLWWRTTPAEIVEHADDDRDGADVLADPEYDQAKRSDIVLGIVELCPNLVEIDFDVEQPRRMGDEIKETALIKYIQSPACAQLRDIAITSSSRFKGFSDFQFDDDLSPWVMPEHLAVAFLVGKPMLEGVTLDGVNDGSMLAPERRLGPLLASLPNLKRLDLSDGRGVDPTWTTLHWKGALTDIALDECYSLRYAGLHAFCHLFAASLETFSVNEHPYSVGEMGDPKFRYVLPKLKALCITKGAPAAFVRSFDGCRALVELDLGDLEDMTYPELEKLIGDRVFPNLKRFLISSDTHLTPADIESLAVYCDSRDVDLVVETDSDGDEDDEDGDDFGSDDEPYLDHDLYDDAVYEGFEDEEDPFATDSDEPDPETAMYALGL